MGDISAYDKIVI